MAANPISIPGASSRMVDVMSPNSISSPLSISSPYSANSSLSSNASNAQTLASSFATSVTSNSTVASALSPSESEGLEIGGNIDGDVNAKKHKPHECDVCGACFARKVHLQRHALRHQVCKPYCCERCGKCFSRQDSLVRHHRLLHEKIKEKPKRTSSSGTSSKKKKSSSYDKDGFCTRCNSLGVKCDGKLPCNRCSTSEYNAQQCSYSTAKATKRAASRRQSVSQMTAVSTSSSFGDEDEDMMSISEEASSIFSPFVGSGHGPRRATVGHMESTSFSNDFHCSFPRVFDDAVTATNSWSNSMHPSHPFDMSQLGSTFMDVKSLHPQQLHQHLTSTNATPMDASQSAFFDATSGNDVYSNHQQHLLHQQAPQSSSHSDHEEVPLLSLYQQPSQESSLPPVPTFDWSSLMQSDPSSEGIQAASSTTTSGRELTQPFSKSASNKSLNATLSRGPEAHDNSCFPSPSVEVMQKLFPTEAQQQAGAVVASLTANPPTRFSSTSNNGTVNLASLGLPVPSNLNITVPADLQMSAENWDNLMRCLTTMATRQGEHAMAS